MDKNQGLHMTSLFLTQNTSWHSLRSPDPLIHSPNCPAWEVRPSGHEVLYTHSSNPSMPLCRLWRAVWCPTLGNSAHVLIPGTPKYVSLHSKMDFTDVVMGHTWRWENHPDYLNEFNLITWVPEGRRGQEGCESERWELEKGPEVRAVCKDLREASRRYGWLPADSQ